MKIAFFSYEYPTETGGGGIGTYLEQITTHLRIAGHTAIVFTATGRTKAFWQDESVYRIPAVSWHAFNQTLPGYFSTIHQAGSFDVAECTDFCACGLYVKKMYPELPVVVKLHTPLFMVDRLLYHPLSLLGKLRFIAGSLVRLKTPGLPLLPQAAAYSDEFELIELAERVSSPSISIFHEMQVLGFNVLNKTDFIPLPFDIPLPIRNITSRQSIGNQPHIIFIGRMEIRKGVIDLALAIPMILKKYPAAHFTFVGGSAASPVRNFGMIDYLRLKLGKHLHAVTFTGKVPHDQITEYLSKGDIFVFPSHYESFGLACCEAMAAGKAVIGSANGGMSEILRNGKCGLVVQPKKPKLLAENVMALIADNLLRVELGNEARKRIDILLAKNKIVALQVACYQKAIDKSTNSNFSSRVGNG